MFLLLALLGYVAARAQVPFEKLDSLSVIVSQWQKMTDGTTYKDAKNALHSLSFPEENFKIWSSDRLASMAVYKQSGDTDLLWLTENIDLTKATGISVSENHFGVAYIKVDFPEGHLQTQIYADGALRETISPSYLEFFCRYGALDPNKKFYFDLMFDMVYAICHMMRYEKGLTNLEAMTAELTDFQNLPPQAFIAKHPQSLLVAQAQSNLRDAGK